MRVGRCCQCSPEIPAARDRPALPGSLHLSRPGTLACRLRLERPWPQSRQLHPLRQWLPRRPWPQSLQQHQSLRSHPPAPQAPLDLGCRRVCDQACRCRRRAGARSASDVRWRSRWRSCENEIVVEGWWIGKFDSAYDLDCPGDHDGWTGDRNCGSYEERARVDFERAIHLQIVWEDNRTCRLETGLRSRR